jgi:pyrroloquinoline-quinone synthase
MRSVATFAHGSFAGKGGAGIVSIGGRMGRAAGDASVARPIERDPGSTTVDFFAELETVRQRWDVLRHPFYTRWSAGELTRPELAAYAGQYRHVVRALADAAAGAARAAGPELRPALERHAAEEASHVELWDRFAAAMGCDEPAEPLPATTACARAWAGEAGRPLARSLAALYAIESGQPLLAETKRTGLVERYGVDPGSDATAYFDVHAVLDVEHAAAERALLEPMLVAGADAEALLEEAEAALRANWELLDGVEEVVRTPAG